MTRDDILKMAREAGFVVTGEAVWKLCGLVAAAEREACIALCKEHSEEYTTFYQHAAAGACEAMAQSIQKRGKV